MFITNQKSGKIHISFSKNNIFQFAVIYLLLLSVLLFFYDSSMHCDSGGYSGQALFLKTNGLFRFDLYRDTYRGYFFSWFLAVLNPGKILGYQAWVFTLPAYTSLVFTVYLPVLYQKVFGCTIDLLKKLIVVCLYLFLFYGLLVYTLSDFYACSFALIAVYYVYKMFDQSGSKSHLSAFLVGIFSYAAYNTRPVYIVFLVILFVAILYEYLKRRNIYDLLFTSIYIIGACVIVAIPQMIINKNVLGMLTPMVINNDHGSLYLLQLNWGLTYGKFETFVGTQLKDVYQIQIKNPFAGPNEWYSLIPYVKFIVFNPIQYLKLLGLHFFNMMDMQYPEVYIKAIRNTTIYRASNYSIVFVLLYVIINEIKNHKGHILIYLKKARYLILLFISSLAIVPGAVETRFGLPVALLFWATAIFGFHPDPNEFNKKQIFIMLPCFVLFMALCFYISHFTVYPTK